MNAHSPFDTTAELKAERDFLLERIKHGDWRWVGMSSNAMVIAVFTSTQPRDLPSDWSDMARCDETYRRAPAHLKALMRPILDSFRRHVKQRYPNECGEDGWCRCFDCIAYDESSPR